MCGINVVGGGGVRFYSEESSQVKFLPNIQNATLEMVSRFSLGKMKFIFSASIVPQIP